MKCFSLSLVVMMPIHLPSSATQTTAADEAIASKFTRSTSKASHERGGAGVGGGMVGEPMVVWKKKQKKLAQNFLHFSLACSSLNIEFVFVFIDWPHALYKCSTRRRATTTPSTTHPERREQGRQQQQQAIQLVVVLLFRVPKRIYKSR